MGGRERSIRYLISTAFPNAYFLDEGLWQASGSPEHLNSLPQRADVANPNRVSNRVYDAIREDWQTHNNNPSEPRQDPFPLPNNCSFELIIYNRVLVNPGYDTFLCSIPGCDRVFTRNEVAPNNYCCTDHRDNKVSQLAHIFVHPVCGNIALINKQRCWNEFQGQRCNTELRLHIEYQQMGASYWWCPTCRYERHLPKIGEHGQPGWQVGSLRQRCNICSIEGQPPQMMTLTPARTLYKPRRVDLVDVPHANYSSLLQEWFGNHLDEDEIRNELPPNLQQAWDDPIRREQILEMYRMPSSDNNGLPSPDPGAQEELTDFAGARTAVVRRLDGTLSNVGNHLTQHYSLTASLLEDLAIVSATYGFLVGSSDPTEALLRVFPMGGPRYAILTQRNRTEAILFQLVADRVLTWLHCQELAMNLEDEMSLRRHIITAEEDDPILEAIIGLIHTASHALRRSSERYTGVGSDKVDELLLPRGLAWILFNNRGSELGMFTTTFEGRMREWLAGARYDLRNCPLDPLCMRDSVAACPGCLYIGERGCTTLWNRHLDRRNLVTLPTSSCPGYWDISRS